MRSLSRDSTITTWSVLCSPILDGPTLNKQLQMIMTASVLYVPCLALAKFSLLLFYHQLSPIRWFKTAVYILMAVVVGYSSAIIFALIFPCNPIAKNWDITITHGTCINRAAIYIATAVVNIATDVMLLILPIPIIVHLQMPTMQKIGVVFIFTLGSMWVFLLLSQPTRRPELIAGKDLYHECRPSHRDSPHDGES